MPDVLAFRMGGDGVSSGMWMIWTGTGLALLARGALLPALQGPSNFCKNFVFGLSFSDFGRLSRESILTSASNS